jgi:rhodanese-related sulfurtransferase
MQRVIRIFLQAGLLAALAAALGAGVNTLRPAGLPWVAREPYAIYKDCPLLTKEAQAVAPSDLGPEVAAVVLLDVRPRADFAAGHPPGARSLPYDPLRPIKAEALRELLALPPGRILVVGDGELDSGRLFAGELAEAGCLGVRYLGGGFEAWREAGLPVEAPVAGEGGAP